MMQLCGWKHVLGCVSYSLFGAPFSWIMGLDSEHTYTNISYPRSLYSPTPMVKTVFEL